MVAGFLAFAAVLSTAHATVETTLCAIVERPHAFSGMVVRFRAGVLTDWHHGMVLVHSGCRHGIDLSSTDAVPPGQSKAFYKAIGTPMDGGPNRTAVATFTGHFSFRPGSRQAYLDNPLQFSAERIGGIKIYPKR